MKQLNWLNILSPEAFHDTAVVLAAAELCGMTEEHERHESQERDEKLSQLRFPNVNLHMMWQFPDDMK